MSSEQTVMSEENAEPEMIESMNRCNRALGEVVKLLEATEDLGVVAGAMIAVGLTIYVDNGQSDAALRIMAAHDSDIRAMRHTDA